MKQNRDGKSPIVLPPFFMSPFFLQSCTCALGLQAGDLGEELRQGVPRVRERRPQTINLKEIQTTIICIKEF